jgi:hypothetical protein
MEDKYMQSLGFPEFMVLIPVVLLSAAFPVAIIVLLIMIFRKVSSIEQRLDKQGG